MFFTFQKYTTVMLFFLSLIAIAPMYLNYTGEGLGAQATNILTRTSLGNLKRFTLNRGAILALENDKEFITQKTDEYDTYFEIYIYYIGHFVVKS